MRRPPAKWITPSVQGAIAGTVGTVAMDLVWYARHRRGGGSTPFVDWELSRTTTSYDNAAAPAQVGKRMVESLFQTELGPGTAATMNNVVHFATGAGWGALHGIVEHTTGKRDPSRGLVTGAAAWLGSYAVLTPAGLYKPIWQYSPKTLAKDLSAHLAFGLATSSTFALLNRPDGRRQRAGRCRRALSLRHAQVLGL
ncbi:MAG: hypothetical protein ACR2OD_05490 [Gaiellaceae bacterium]